jgi:4-hydroxy-tetrahydrodipicolinate reductase
MRLTGAIARSSAGRPLGAVLDIPELELEISATAQEALEKPCDVFVEFSMPDAAKAHVLQALAAGTHVVIGTSGLTDTDFDEIDQAAKQAGRGVLAAGNFALTAVLLQKFATMAARHIPHWEIIEYAGATKIDAPSGTARELAYRLGKVQQPKLAVPVNQTVGPQESRGVGLSGCQVHSVRLHGYESSMEVIFGLPEMRLSLRHDAGTSAQPYIDGTLLAIRKVSKLKGLRRGLDTVMDL